MGNWVDFAAVKKHLGLASVLRHYQVSLRRSGRDQYRGRCPLHQGDGREAFHANLTRNVFHCFSCGAGGTVLDFVAAMEGCTLREAALKLQGGTDRPPIQRPTMQLVTKKSKVPLPLGFTLRGIDHTHPYLAARGIEAATAEEFGIGFYGGCGIFSGRLVIPIHNACGERVAYCGRVIDRTQPRYRFPSGFPKSEVLFNLHRAAAAGQQTAIVVEGFFDCMRVHQAAISSVVALRGSALSQPQATASIGKC